MKATRTLRPSASSPLSVHGPSASTCPRDHALAALHERDLVDAGVLVGTLELDQRVDIHARVPRAPSVVALPLDPDDDPGGVDAVDHARAFADHHGAGVFGRDVLHARADVGGLRVQQRHGLALHVRTHQGAVGIVVLEERNQARRHADKLLRGHVDVLRPARGARARSCPPCGR